MAEMQTTTIELWNEIASIKHQLCTTEGNLIKEENAVEPKEEKDLKAELAVIVVYFEPKILFNGLKESTSIQKAVNFADSSDTFTLKLLLATYSIQTRAGFML